MVNLTFTQSQQNVSPPVNNRMMQTVWQRIEAELRRRGRTDQWLADELGYSKQRVNNWSRRGVPATEHSNLARVLGKTLDWVALGVEDDEDDLTRARARHVPDAHVNKEKSLNFSVRSTQPGGEILTHYPKSPPVISDWASFGSRPLSSTEQAEPFEALVAPGPFPKTYEMTRVPGHWMEPEIFEGDWIWIDRTVTPQNDDVVIAESTETRERFMGIFSRGYREREFFVTPKRGERADSTKHPIQVLAVMMARLEVRRARFS